MLHYRVFSTLLGKYIHTCHFKLIMSAQITGITLYEELLRELKFQVFFNSSTHHLKLQGMQQDSLYIRA